MRRLMQKHVVGGALLLTAVGACSSYGDHVCDQGEHATYVVLELPVDEELQTCEQACIRTYRGPATTCTRFVEGLNDASDCVSSSEDAGTPADGGGGPVSDATNEIPDATDEAPDAGQHSSIHDVECRRVVRYYCEYANDERRCRWE